MAQVKFNYGTNKTELDKKSLAEGSIWFSTEDGKLNIDVKDGNATLKRTTVNAAKADEASKLSTARSITIKGGVSSTTTFDGTKNIELTVPAATNKVAGVTVVYPAAECTSFTSDSGTCTPAAVKKAVTLFGVSNAGDTMSGDLIFSNPNATVPGDHPHIEWNAIGANTPYIGYATDQTDGTFLIGSLKGTTYGSGLAIGGGSGNLLWQGKKVLTIDNSCVATQSMNGSMSANDKKKVDVTNVAYGTCSTAAATAAKVISTTGNTDWQLVAGSMVTVLFTNTNTASNPTFNVNGTGAKNVFYEGAQITTSNKGYAGTTKRPMTFIYDGTQYRFVSWAYDGNTNTYVRTYKDETGTYPVLASRTAASSWDATYESVYGTISSNITMTPSTGTVTATKFSGSGASLTSLNANNISSGKLGLAYGGTGANLSAIPAGAIVRNSTDGSGFWYTASAAGALYCEGTNAASKFGTLPVKYGGTGATTAAAALTNLGLTATATELNYVDGVTSNIQTQLNGKAPKSHASTATTYGVSTAANYGHAMASSTTPKANGTAKLGSETAKFARGDHVHPLQTTVSGNAGTATKLATARTIYLGDQLQGSASFNGSANITINAQLKNVSVGGANTNTYLYRRFASGAPGTGQYEDYYGIFLIASNYHDGSWGIIKVAHRVNNTGASCGMSARWLVRDGFAEDSISVASYGVSGDDVYFDVFFKCHTSWPRVTITSLGPTNLSLYSSSEGTDSSSPSEAYTTIANAGTSLHGKAYTNIVASVQAGIYGAVWN